MDYHLASLTKQGVMGQTERKAKTEADWIGMVEACHLTYERCLFRKHKSQISRLRLPFSGQLQSKQACYSWQIRTTKGKNPHSVMCSIWKWGNWEYTASMAAVAVPLCCKCENPQSEPGIISSSIISFGLRLNSAVHCHAILNHPVIDAVAFCAHIIQNCPGLCPPINADSIRFCP